MATPAHRVVLDSVSASERADLPSGTPLQARVVEARDRTGNTDPSGRFEIVTRFTVPPWVSLRDSQTGREIELPGQIAADGTDAPSPPLTRPVWSASGRFVSYVAGKLGSRWEPEQLRVVILDIQTLGVRVIEEGSWHAPGIRGSVWQRDQDRLAYEHDDGVFVLDAISGGAERIGTGSRAEFVTAQLLSFRSSGSVLYDVGLKREVFRIAGATLESIEYTDGRLRAVGRSDSPECSGAIAVHPSRPVAICLPASTDAVWAPDGFRVAMLRTGASQTHEVLIYDVRDGVTRTLATGLPQPVRCEWAYYLNWTADSQYVVLDGLRSLCGV